MLKKLGRETVLAAAFSVLAMPAWADANADANRLFVEAMQAWKQVEQIQGDSLQQAETRLELLQEIEANLSRIVERYSASDLAVQLLLGPVGPLELDRLPELIERAEEQRKQSFVAGSLVVAGAEISSGELVRAGKTLLQARDTAQQITSSEDRSRALRTVADAQVGAGDVSGAVSTAQTIESAYNRSWALIEIAAAQAKAGDIAGAQDTLSLALQTAQQIEGGPFRSEVLSAIAVLLAEAGDVSGGLETAQTIEDAYNRSRAQGEIAAAQAEAGDVSGALETAQTIEDAYNRSEVLSAIAARQARGW